MRILLSAVAVLALGACGEEAPAPEPVAVQSAAPAEPQTPGTSDLKAALIGGCPEVARRVSEATCEANEDEEFACTYTLVDDEAERSTRLASEGESWKLVDVPEECSAA